MPKYTCKGCDTIIDFNPGDPKLPRTLIESDADRGNVVQVKCPKCGKVSEVKVPKRGKP